MALFGLGISATIKGVSGLFRGARKVIKNFRAKRKQETAKFKEKLMGQAGQLGSFGEAAPPNNPLGVTPMPMPAVKTSFADEGYSRSLRQRSGTRGQKSKPLFKIGSFEVTPVIAGIGAGALALIGYLTMGRKKRRRR